MKNEPIVTCECSADPPRTADECRQWNAQHNPGTLWAERECDCDCHEDDAADVPAASRQMTVGREIAKRGDKPVLCPTCGKPAEPQMDSSTHTMYWCGNCWVNHRKPVIFDVAHPAAVPAASTTREEQG